MDARGIIERGLILDLGRIRQMGRAAVLAPEAARSLRESAERALALPPQSVVDKSTTPPSGDKHDYMSVGPYWWPNPQTPDGLPYIRRDGEVHPDFLGNRYDTLRLERMTAAVGDLALAWLVSSEQQFAEHAAMLVRAWFLVPATWMNPNLVHGQSIPGICSGRGIGLIDTARFARSLDHILLLYHAGAITAEDLEGLRHWFSRYLDWMLEHEYGIAERKEHNNHGTWCDVQLAAYALFAGRDALAREVLAEAPERRIFAHVEPDGRQPHELARTKAFSYSCYNLQGLFALGWLSGRVGQDIWNRRSSDGRCLRAAIDWLAPYVDESRPWPYQQIMAGAGADNPSLGKSARAPLYPLLREAALAWREGNYLELAQRHPAAARDYAAVLSWPA